MRRTLTMTVFAGGFLVGTLGCGGACDWIWSWTIARADSAELVGGTVRGVTEGIEIKYADDDGKRWIVTYGFVEFVEDDSASR